MFEKSGDAYEFKKNQNFGFSGMLTRLSAVSTPIGDLITPKSGIDHAVSLWIVVNSGVFGDTKAPTGAIPASYYLLGLVDVTSSVIF